MDDAEEGLCKGVFLIRRRAVWGGPGIPWEKAPQSYHFQLLPPTFSQKNVNNGRFFFAVPPLLRNRQRARSATARCFPRCAPGKCRWPMPGRERKCLLAATIPPLSFRRHWLLRRHDVSPSPLPPFPSTSSSLVSPFSSSVHPFLVPISSPSSPAASPSRRPAPPPVSEYFSNTLELTYFYPPPTNFVKIVYTFGAKIFLYLSTTKPLL